MPARGEREADPRVDREMRHGEAGDARERQLHDGDLADKPGDHHERERHHDPDQRVGQRLTEVERQHDEGHRADEGQGDSEGEWVLRLRHVRQTLFDELTPSGQRCSAQEHRSDDEHEDEQLLRPGIANPSDVGNHDFVDAYSITDSIIPIASPLAQAIANEVEPCEQRGGERWNDQEWERERVERGNRAREDAERTQDEAGDHHVHQGQLVGRETRKLGGHISNT